MGIDAVCGFSDRRRRDAVGGLLVRTMTVGQIIRGLKKYKKDLIVVQAGVPIKAMRIWDPHPERRGHPLCVRFIRQDEQR